MRVRSLESRILGARPSESMSPGLALLNGDFEILAIADIDFVVWAKSRVKDKKPVFFMMSRMTNTIFKSNFGVGIMFYNRTFTNTTAYFIFASSAGVEYKDMAL